MLKPSVLCIIDFNNVEQKLDCRNVCRTKFTFQRKFVDQKIFSNKNLLVKIFSTKIYFFKPKKLSIKIFVDENLPVCIFERRRSIPCSCCTGFRAWRTCPERRKEARLAVQQKLK